MDWSLVLISQGIESIIERPENGSGWALVVAPEHSQTAIKTLRQYHVENRGWPWQQHVFSSGFVFDYASLAWALLAAFFYWFSSVSDLRTPGAMDSTAVGHGEWWRLFTAMWLHSDLAHLGANLAIGVVLLGLAMGCYGSGPALLAAYLAGAGGNLLATVVASQTHRNVGASGMIMGSLGLLAAHSITLWRKSPLAPRYIVSGIVGGIMLFVLLGLTPGTDIIAHLGGFLSGFFLGAVLSLIGDRLRATTAQAVFVVIFVLMVIVPWFLALRGR